MDTTVTMWLGIWFLILAVVATVLQAWLWSFPMMPDPGGPDPNGKSTAPKIWVSLHRLCGFVYLIIYVILMWEMIPRMWEYQVELPARTVMHATMGMGIGILLIGKIAIIRWFQHFGKALPALGFALFGCTIILSTLSIPFAMRAHGIGSRDFGPEQLVEIRADLEKIEFPTELNVNLDELASREALAKGRSGLVGKCTDCHDLRTILAKARSPESWFKVVVRMAEKPTLHSPITADELAPITAYLVAITPDITTSLISKHKDSRTAKSAVTPMSTGELEKAKGLYEEKCAECHELSNVEDHGRDSRENWNAVIQTMIEEFGAELEDADAELILNYLATVYGTGDQPAPAPEPEPAPAPEPEPEPAAAPDAGSTETAPAPDPEPEPAQPEEDKLSCYDECMKMNQPRAVAIEIIEADCKKSCSEVREPLTP